MQQAHQQQGGYLLQHLFRNRGNAHEEAGGQAAGRRQLCLHHTHGNYFFKSCTGAKSMSIAISLNAQNVTTLLPTNFGWTTVLLVIIPVRPGSQKWSPVLVFPERTG